MFECRRMCSVNVFSVKGLNLGKYTVGHSYCKKQSRLRFYLYAHTYISNVTLSSANFADHWSKDIFLSKKKKKNTNNRY